ncbi:sensor histidine kinase [Pedobacter alpinus]|uniref:histidine kinase n=1 Tax=Pedobacter alpinus TaxID=1590643 RepID=A0ABW5TQF8_9SPHI
MLILKKQEITTLVSHNLRTPLNQILGFCELIRIDKESDIIYVDKIESITKLQLQNLSELLVQLMVNTDLKQLENAPFDVNELVKTELEVTNLAVAKKNITVTLNLTEEKITSNKNKNKIALVVQNLISNAIKFSYRGQEIKISTLKKDNHIEIIVEDKGIGFSEAYSKNIFKDARNVGREGTEKEPSVGLGLHLCKRTINQLNGQLLAFSDGENKGATFKIIL